MMLRDFTRSRATISRQSPAQAPLTIETLRDAVDRIRKYAHRIPPELRYVRRSSLEAIRDSGATTTKVWPSTYLIQTPGQDDWLAAVVADEAWDELFPQEVNDQ
jgi:hypothetical protein